MLRRLLHDLLNRRILIVEDQEDIVQAYRDILSPKTNVAKIKRQQICQEHKF